MKKTHTSHGGANVLPFPLPALLWPPSEENSLLATLERCTPDELRWISEYMAQSAMAAGPLAPVPHEIDISERKRMEDALSFVAQRGWKDVSDRFFDALVQYLGKTLDVDCVFIDRLDDEPGVAEAVALYARGDAAPNMRYGLSGTPCGNVMGKNPCCYRQGVQHLFPEDSRLLDMGVESYAGIPLWDSKGQAIGLIAIMDSKPLADNSSHVQLLQIAASRAAAELERERSDRLMAHTDALTQLGNRQALNDHAPALLTTAQRYGRRVGVMLLDLDQFGVINDSLGHCVGDELLRQTGKRLSDCTRANDLVVRFGGDEFIIIAPNMEGAAAMGSLADKVHKAMRKPMKVGGHKVDMTVSIGISLFPMDGECLDALLAYANFAMYQAKRQGRGRTEYYRRQLGDALCRRTILEAAMRDAQHGMGLELYLRPQVALQEGAKLIGAQALLRWQHPQLGCLSSDEFMPVAEVSGMIVPMGRWVLRKAVEAVVRWNHGRAEPLSISVNVSAKQFGLDDVVAEVCEVLTQTGCNPGWLVLEITESLVSGNSTTVKSALDALHCVGVKLSINNFGRGDCALNYLAQFAVDELKIDTCFVQEIGCGRRQDNLIKAIIAMAKVLRLRLVAEGVETEAQAEFLLRNGCARGQGYRFGWPVPLAQFELELLKPAF